MSRATSMLAAIGATMLIFLTLGAWSLASPVGSSPDDDFHLASIWCGQGERDGLCADGSEENSLMVPSKAITAPCFAFEPEVRGECQGEDFMDSGFHLAETTRVNSGTQYPPGFYYATGYFATDNITLSTIVIRLANAALFSVLLSLTWKLLPSRFRFTLAGSVALTFVPLALFIVPSTNPSSWSIMSGALLIPSLLGYFATSGRARWALAAIATVAGLLAVSSRADSAIYLIVGAAAAMALSFEKSSLFARATILPIAIAACGLVAFFSAGQSGLALSGDGAVVTDSKPQLAILNLLTISDLWNGIYGDQWGLGWLDTSMPPMVSAICLFLTSGVLFSSLRWLNWRRALALAGVGSAAVIVPVYILVQSGYLVGSHIQPRYVLPLLTMLVAVAIAPSIGKHPSAHSGLQLSRLQLWLIGGGLTAAYLAALFATLHRYVSAGTYFLDSEMTWWWRAGPSPFGLLAIGGLACAATMVMFVHANARAAAAALSESEAPESKTSRA